LGAAIRGALRHRADFAGTGQTTEAQKNFEQLKSTYPYSPKLLETDYGIAETLARQNKHEEALRILANISKQTHAPAPLRAKAMLLLAKVCRRRGNTKDAINNL
jgi:TolA-binding protein